MTLQNLKVLITGGTSGLGLELVREFLKAGSKVFMTGLDKLKIDTTLASFGDHPNLQGFVVNINDLQALNELKNNVGDLDILINNAGVYTVGLLENTSPMDIQKVIQTNLIGTIFVTQTFLPILKAKNNGIIANILSIRSNEPAAESSIYAASKFGLRGFFESLKLELEKTNVKIINFYPSGIKTSLFQNAGVVDKDMANLMEASDVAQVVIDTIQKSDKTLIDHIVIQKPKKVMDSP
jgi:NADP-dependent 3-hydroxy acid dehydrogenase YdfG